jgi:pyrroloquinoline quinone biosynthesis protein B
MFVRVLGASAGGGFPQWNCNCRNCDGVRKGTIRASRRTQSSICVSDDGVEWVLFNTSPDLLQQIQSFPPLQPGRLLRDTGIAAIILIDGQIDHTTGLFMLRERGVPLDLWCTAPVHSDLTSGNPIFRILGHFAGVNWHEIAIAGTFKVPALPHLEFTALPLKSKAAPYSPHRDDPHPGDNIGVSIRDTRSGKTLFYAPGLGEIEPAVWAAMSAADCVLVDGTFWTDDEMIKLDIAPKTSREIGHLPQSGAGGMIEHLDRLPAATRRVLIHINNTNPILDEDSPERATLGEHHIEVAHDGLEIHL